MQQKFLDQFTIDLPKLRDAVSGILYCMGKSYDVDEIINTAFVKLYDSGNDYFYHSFKSICIAAIHEQSDNLRHFEYLEDYKHSLFIPSLEDKQCKCCNDVFPISNFNKTKTLADGRICWHSLCKACQLKRSKELEAKDIQKRREQQRKSKAKKRALGKKMKPIIKRIEQQKRHAEIYKRIAALKNECAAMPV